MSGVQLRGFHLLSSLAVAPLSGLRLEGYDVLRGGVVTHVEPSLTALFVIAHPFQSLSHPHRCYRVGRSFMLSGFAGAWRSWAGQRAAVRALSPFIPVLA